MSFLRLLICLLSLFTLNAVANNPYEKTQPEAAKWYQAGQTRVASSKALMPAQKPAKNVILFIGDGMGISSITAIRIMAGQQEKKLGEAYQLSYEKFPYLALSKTYNTNFQVPDSAGTMTAMITGVKTSAGVLSIDETVKLGDFKRVKGHTLRTLTEEAADWGLATGVVTTARITHATPGATYAHTPHRDWETYEQLPKAAQLAKFPDIAAQFLTFNHGKGLNLMMGGGRDYFTQRGDGRNLVEEWKIKYPQGVYLTQTKDLDQIDWKKTQQVLGLFSPSHMTYESDRDQSPQGEPSLSQMTKKAIEFLSQHPEGYFLIVEGGRVDHAHHDGNAYRALTEGVELAKAVEVANQMTSDEDTMIILTADHSHTFTMNGYPVINNPILGKVITLNEETGKKELAKDSQGLPYTTLQYANGPGARPHADLTEVDTTAKDYKQEALVHLESETHGGEDVAIYARGPGSPWVHGTMEQSVIYHIMRESMKRQK